MNSDSLNISLSTEEHDLLISLLAHSTDTKLGKALLRKLSGTDRPYYVREYSFDPVGDGASVCTYSWPFNTLDDACDDLFHRLNDCDTNVDPVADMHAIEKLVKKGVLQWFEASDPQVQCLARYVVLAHPQCISMLYLMYTVDPVDTDASPVPVKHADDNIVEYGDEVGV